MVGATHVGGKVREASQLERRFLQKGSSRGRRPVKSIKVRKRECRPLEIQGGGKGRAETETIREAYHRRE